MSGSRTRSPGRSGAASRFVVDSNVFVAAVKPFSNRDRGLPGASGSLALLLALVTDDRVELFGDRTLLREYTRLGEKLDSDMGALVLRALSTKVDVVDAEEEAVARCKPFLPEGADADTAHAATSLQTGAILITNDRDFGRIKKAGIIQVWSIGEAIRRLSILKRRYWLSSGNPRGS